MKVGDRCPNCGEGRLVKAYGMLGGASLVHLVQESPGRSRICFQEAIDDRDLYGEGDG